MDFYVCLERPGFRVARRRRIHNRVGVQHRITKEDAMKWCVLFAARGWAAVGVDALLCGCSPDCRTSS
jgi:hypothetical protein